MFRKIITIVIPIIAITAAILLFGIKVYQDSYSEFQSDGFVIGKIEGKESEKYYFSNGNKYKVNETKNEVTFENTDNEEVIVPEGTFVHYSDGSISTFKKAVVLNIANVKNDTLQYYNIFKGSVFTKTSEGHQIKYLEQKLAFGNFLVKITDTKYMLVGKNLKVKYGSEEKVIADGFLEINYLDGNIIRIENQDLMLQNISSDLTVEVDAVKLDLIDKKIIYNDETKVNLGEITIDSDDNIEIIPDEEKPEIEDPYNSVDFYENQATTSPGVNMGGMQSGVVDTTAKNPDQVVEENATIPDAEFTVRALSVSTSVMNASIAVTDKESVLRGDVTWKVVENATNQIVCMKNVEYGQTLIQLECNQLTPDTNYSLIVRSQYSKNDVNYEKDFVQKTFVTSTMGIAVDKDYVSKSEVSFLLEINKAVGVQSFKYDLVGPEGTMVTGVKYEVNEENIVRDALNPDVLDPNSIEDVIKLPLTFDNTNAGGYTIRTNSKYTLIIYGIVVDNVEISETNKIYKTLTTLKAKPKFNESTSVAINKQNSKFILYLNNVSDPDNGILSYRADIYDANNVGGPETIITSRTSATAQNLEIEVDGGVIQRDVGYRAKMYLTYFDNEMEYEIYVGYQDMNMNSKGLPSVSFEKTEITNERIVGKVSITDTNEVINFDKVITITVANVSIGHESKTNTYKISNPGKSKFDININENNLKSNETYIFTISAYVDLNDRNGERVMDISEFMVSTREPYALNASLVDTTAEHGDSQFTISVHLAPSNPDLQGTLPNEMSIMSEIEFRVYSINYDPDTQVCVASNKCWTFAMSDQDVVDPYNSTLTGDLFYNEPLYKNKYTFKPYDDFGITSADMPYGNYKIKIMGAVDYTQYHNNLPINNTELTFNPNASVDSIVGEKKFVDTPILNSHGVVERNPELAGSTIVGYKIIPDVVIPTKIRSQYTITYTIKDLVSGHEETLDPSELLPLYDATADDGNNAVAIMFQNVQPNGTFVFTRGTPYAISYKVAYTLPGSTTQYAESGFKPLNTQPVKETPSIQVYLLRREEDNDQLWQFYIRDVDNALTTMVDKGGVNRGLTAFYKKSGELAEYNAVYCGSNYTETAKCFQESASSAVAAASGTFLTKNVIDDTITIKTDALLLRGYTPTGQTSCESEDCAPNKKELRVIEEMSFYGVYTYGADIKYTMSETENGVVYAFQNYNLSDLAQVIQVRMTLTAANGGTKTIYKTFDNNGYETPGSSTYAQISLDYSEIAELKEKGNITTKIEFLYERNMPGYELPTNEDGYAIEERISGVNVLQNYDSHYKIFKDAVYTRSTGKLTFKDIEGKSYSYTLSDGLKGLVYDKDGTSTVIIVKAIGKKEGTCTGTCTFKFDVVKPSLYMSAVDITPMIGGVKLRPQLVVEESLAQDMNLVVKYSKQDGNGACGIDLQELKINYKSEIEGKNYELIINTLELGVNYCTEFYWENSTLSNQDFFYGTEFHTLYPDLNRQTYRFTTLVKPTLSSIIISYDTGSYVKGIHAAYPSADDKQKQHNLYNRSITVSYDTNTLENYEGYKYKIYDYNTGNVISTMENINIEDFLIDASTERISTTIPIDVIDSKKTLKANTKYILGIIPFQNCEEGMVGCTADGIRLLGETRQTFTFSIKQPTIRIQRITNNGDESGHFSIRVTASDIYRAAGGYAPDDGVDNSAKYFVQVYDNLGNYENIGEITATYSWASKAFYNIGTCKGDTNCQVRVIYEADLENEGFKQSYTETKDITVSSPIDIGYTSVIETSTTSVRLGFTESYNITSIKTIDYTITPTSGNGDSTTVEDSVVTWIPGEGEEYYYLDILTPLMQGAYTMQVTFKDYNELVVATASYTLIIQ